MQAVILHSTFSYEQFNHRCVYEYYVPGKHQYRPGGINRNDSIPGLNVSGWCNTMRYVYTTLLISVITIQYVTGAEWNPTNEFSGGTASCDGYYAGQPAANAFDGNASSWWGNYPSALPHWVQVDIGEAKQIRKWTVNPYTDAQGGSINSYTIGGSSDGTNFTTLVSGSCGNNGDPVTVSNTTATSYQHYRLTISSNYRSDNWGICEEFEGYTFLTPEEEGGGTNGTGTGTVYCAWTTNAIMVVTQKLSEAVTVLIVVTGQLENVQSEMTRLLESEGIYDLRNRQNIIIGEAGKLLTAIERDLWSPGSGRGAAEILEEMTINIEAIHQGFFGGQGFGFGWITNGLEGEKLRVDANITNEFLTVEMIAWQWTYLTNWMSGTTNNYVVPTDELETNDTAQADLDNVTNTLGTYIDEIGTATNELSEIDYDYMSFIAIQMPSIDQISEFQIPVPDMAQYFFNGTNIVVDLADYDIIPAFRIFELFLLYGFALVCAIKIVRNGIA